MELDLLIIILLIGTGLVAGFIDALAGGGGMVALPVLLSTGMTPVEALATNKLQGSFGSFSSSWYFVSRNIVNLSEMKLMLFCTFAGAVIGTLLVQVIDSEVMAMVMPVLLIAIAIYFMFAGSISDDERQPKVSYALFALLFTTAIGFYDGFFGPGTGTFFALAFVSLMGFGLTKATAHTKVLNFTSNIASLMFFAIGGNVVWLAGFAMAAGQLVGGQLGARVVVKRGSRLIRPLVVVVTLLVSAKLLWQQF